MLLLEDDISLIDGLTYSLKKNGFIIETARTIEEAEKFLAECTDFDLLLFDVTLPDGSAFALCEKIREAKNPVPIIFLTARIEDADKINGFAVGGDDYMVKPFSIDELGARVAAHIRREHRSARQANVRYFGKMAIDYTAKTVSADGDGIDFPKKEFEILELLSMNAGQVFDKERIYELLWGYDAQGDSSVVAEHIRRIRVRLRAAGEEYHLETVWGLGYKWVG